MKYYDISLSLSAETVRWITSPPFELHERRRMSRGDPNNSSGVTMSLHAGTHMDAPFHFVPDGAAIDELPLDLFIGPALVHAVETERTIGAEHIEAIDLNGLTRVLFKTRNSELLQQGLYDPDFVAFSIEAAKALVTRGVKLVGLDYLSVARAGEEQVPVHRAFLDRGVALLEGVDLSGIEPGRYELICFPIRIRGADGAPCRAVLRDPTK
ncbi:MAG TPA: cyclase family protein [Candidatus Binatia bacterium]|jgi:arylformamidase